MQGPLLSCEQRNGVGRTITNFPEKRVGLLPCKGKACYYGRKLVKMAAYLYLGGNQD